MSAEQLLRFLTQGLFLLVFVSAAVQAFRRPWRANLDIALLFGAVSLVIAESWVVGALGASESRWLSLLVSAIMMALPYLLMRLLDDFTAMPGLVLRATEAGLVLSLAGLLLFSAPRPLWLTAFQVLYFVTVEGYAAAAFVRQGRRSSGVTRRRMQAVAAGSICLGLVILAAGLQLAVPGPNGIWIGLAQVFALASGGAYFLGFATPSFLRRAWQEPELRAFLARAASLPRLPDTASIVRELEHGSAASLGAPHARIGLWDDDAGVLRFQTEGGTRTLAPGQMIAGRTFALQRATFAPNAPGSDPGHAAAYEAAGSRAVMAAPITAGRRKLGVLVAYAPRAPIFADDDLALVQLLAEQAAVILESRALIDEAARVQAREEASRLKDDFLSAAAHDLKTPLTTLVAQAQHLERRALAAPEAPVDLRGVQRLVGEAQRLKSLVLELLDAARAEGGRLLGEREVVDLVEVAREACARHQSEWHHCVLETAGPVEGEYDRTRVAQLLDNLLENSVKYSPGGGEVHLKVWREGSQARIAVSDSGIGIPPADLPHVFERFHRGANVDDRRFAGMGLGLFICRGIAEQHGGTIAATSVPGQGTTIQVALPASVEVLAT